MATSLPTSRRNSASAWATACSKACSQSRPLAVNTMLIGFELLVACLQAYVFAVLTCIYLHDAVHLH